MPLEIEFDMLISYYLAIMKLYKTRFQTIPAEGYYEMQEFIRNHMPEYKKNPYIPMLLSWGQKALIEFIDKPMREQELQALHNILKKMDI